MTRIWLALALVIGFSGCADSRVPAPVTERGVDHRPAGVHAAEALAPMGAYLVKAGDTLFKIAFEHDIDYRLLARMNGLSDPYLIHPRRMLRVPGTTRDIDMAGQPDAPGMIVARSLPSAVARTPGEPVDIRPEAWVWPARGTVIADFDRAKGRKGLDIAGRRDAPVLAASAGTVVYAGSALRGYGKLTIIKHGPTLLSAYGHQSMSHVTEGQRVATGQAIGGMGDSDAERVKLHFEVREYGKPVDPRLFLPRTTRSEHGPG